MSRRDKARRKARNAQNQTLLPATSGREVIVDQTGDLAQYEFYDNLPANLRQEIADAIREGRVERLRYIRIVTSETY